MLEQKVVKEILEFWFGNNIEYREYWFDGTKDSYIIEKYSKTLVDLEENYKNINIEDIDSIIAAIIVLDQFSRSIYKKENKEKIKRNDSIAFMLSSLLLEKKYDKDLCLPKRIFMLMPYRHQNKSDCLDFVMCKIKEYREEFPDSILLSRFRKATLMNYTKLTDKINCVEYNEYKDNEYNEYKEYNEYSEIIDKNCIKYDYNKENLDISSNCLYKTVISFIKDKDIKNIGVSLSGGVDSMVILYILSKLRDNRNIKNIYALHIEYCNREESVLETELISKYCKKLNVILYVRKIDYMSRESVDRNFYEEETRKVRFFSYNYLSNKYSISGWCLGHHRGDISENILMNICNGRNLLDLTVMKKESELLYRPLLDHPKSDIYDFAHKNHIPYLKDTTPDWSCRGVIRRKLYPIMKEQWPMIDKNLLEIGKQSEELEQIFRTFVLEPLKKGIIINKDRNIVDIDISNISKHNITTIWMNLFLYIFHSIGINMISHKNLSYFLESFSRNYEKKNRFIFSNGCIGIFMGDKIRIIKVNK